MDSNMRTRGERRKRYTEHNPAKGQKANHWMLDN
jgi:hypothetical protein